mmetsp:Transcript_31767/g.49272  ORF Transcript_31767/g.49272 Transcript_31767/m.49272 type:complete len:109 (+) Transcript_31767:273-599(+)
MRTSSGYRSRDLQNASGSTMFSRLVVLQRNGVSKVTRWKKKMKAQKPGRRTDHHNDVVEHVVSSGRAQTVCAQGELELGSRSPYPESPMTRGAATCDTTNPAGSLSRG